MNNNYRYKCLAFKEWRDLFAADKLVGGTDFAVVVRLRDGNLAVGESLDLLGELRGRHVRRFKDIAWHGRCAVFSQYVLVE